MTFWKLTAGVTLMILAALLATLACANTSYPIGSLNITVAVVTYLALADLFYFRFLNKKAKAAA